MQHINDEYSGYIGFIPLKDEPNFLTNKPTIIKKLNNFLNIPQDKKTDIKKYLILCNKIKTKKKIIILVPGRCFDKYGNRKGRGYGWYDRFLSKLPKKFIKIGLSLPINMNEVIKTKKHDQRMDQILLLKNNKWETIFDSTKKKHIQI